MLLALAVHVALAFQDPAAMADTALRAAVKEAAVIWAPYGLVLERAGVCDPPDPDTLVLAVDAVADTPPGRLGVVLGAIAFGPDGTPQPRISVFLSEVVRFVADTRVLGASEPEWPRALREEIIGRVVGRVLAHEIGHYVLGQKQHATAGLMRPLQRSDELVSPSRATFRLSAAEAAQLRARSPDSSVVKKKRTDTYGRP
jgi:hypothetical protein